MNKKVITFISFIGMAAGSFVSAQPNLESYLKNDVQLKKLAVEVQKAALSENSTEISKGVDVQLSSGTARFIFNDSSTSVEFSPSASLTVPQAANLKASISSSVTIVSGSSSTKNTKLSLSADLISGTSITRKVELLQSDRKLLEAKRALQNRSLEAEKNYYESLKSLFDSADKIVALQKDCYDDRISFEEIKAKGYAKTSSKYRQAELKVLSEQHEIDTKIRELERDCAVFASKCSVEFKNGTNPKDFLPKEIPQVEPVDILSFDQNDYTKIESAIWTKEINTLKRKADKRFTLSANAGYTFKNSNSIITKNSNITTADDYYDTADAGLTAGWDGLSINTGVSIPVGSGSTNPIYTVGMTLNPNKFRTASITRKTNNLAGESEELDIQNAIEDYNTVKIDKQSELSDIIWSKEKNKETYDMYVSLNDDLKDYLKKGVITESEYLNSFANREDYSIKMLMNDIDLIIYNNAVKLLFCRDNEISGEN